MPQITLATFQSKVYSRLDGNTRLYPAADVTRRINEALRVTNLFTGWSQGKVPAGVTVADRNVYRTPRGMLVPLKLYLEGREVMSEGARGLSGTRRDWLKGRGSQVGYSIPLGVTLFVLSPAPKISGQFIETWGITEPTLFVNASDTVDLADSFAELVVEYAYQNLCMKEPGKIFMDASKSYKPWLKKINELRRWQSQISPHYGTEQEKAA